MLAQNMYIHHLAALFVIYTQVHHHNQNSEQEIQKAIRSLLEEYIQAQSGNRLPAWENESASTKLPTLLQQFAKSYQLSQIGVALHKYLLALQTAGRLPATIKNYRSDIGQYLSFVSSNSPDQIVQKTEVAHFIEYEQTRGSSNSTIQRKLASMGQFFQWLQENGWLTTNQWKSFSAQEFTELLKGTKSVRELTTPVSQVDMRPAVWSLPLKIIDVQQYLPKHFTNSPIKKIKKAPFFSRIKQAMGAQPLLGYFNLAMGVLFLIGTTFLGYQQFFSGADSSQAFPANLTRPNRSLSFQGRLTSATRTPITAVTPMRFRLYDSGPATGSGNLLWDSTSCNIDPDQDGIFSTTLGDACGTEITSDVFTENSNVWLEVQVNSEILNPRQSIKTVAYALNSETLQGYPASASAVESTVLVMRSDGKVVFGNANPILEATGDSFAITAKTLTLESSSGSNGDVIINPDGTGQTLINSNTLIEGYLSAPGATLSATYAGGRALTLKAGPSATGDIMQWQTSAGTPLGVIDKSGNIGIGTTIARAALEIAGSASSSGTLTFKGTTDPKIDILNGENFGIRTSVGGDTGLTETLTVLNSGNVGIGTTAPGAKLAIANTGTANGIILGSDQSTPVNIYHSNSPVNGVLYLSGSRLQLNGTYTTINSTYTSLGTYISNSPIVLGGQNIGFNNDNNNNRMRIKGGIGSENTIRFLLSDAATEVFRIDSAGSASSSGILSFRGTTDPKINILNGEAFGIQTSVGGDAALTERLTILNNGNVGIGSATPSQKLEVGGEVEIANYLYFANGATNYLRFDGSDFLLSNDFLPSANNTYALGSNAARWSAIYGTAIYQGGNQVCDTSGNCSSVGNLWQYANGGISPATPYTSVADFYIGGNATASAKFGLLNVNSGTPTASISAGAAGATFLTASGYLSTTARQNLTLGNSSTYNTTGNILLNPNGTGNVGIGTTNPAYRFHVSGGTLAVDSGSGTDTLRIRDGSITKTVGDYFTWDTGIKLNTGSYNQIIFGTTTPAANGSGLVSSGDMSFWTSGYTNRPMYISSAGNVGIGTTTPTALLDIAGTASSSGTLAFRGTTDPKIDILNGENFSIRTSVGGDVGLTERLTILNGGNVGIGSTAPAQRLDVVGNLQFSGALMPNAQAGTSTYLLTSAGANNPPTWQNPATFISQYDLWSLSSGAIFPKNSTTDLLVGGNSTASAKFGFINVNSGTPTASISGTIGATFLTANGNLSTTNRQSLTLGNSAAYNTTGNILLNPNGTGNVGIGTTNPTSPLQVGSAGSGRISVPGLGSGSEQFGYLADADGTGSTALGYSSSAGGQSSMAIGYSTSASGVRGLAIGYDATNTGNDSMVIGNSASVGHNSIVIGQSASTTQTYAIVLGRSATVTGTAGIAIGESAAAGANQFVSGSSSYPISDVYFGKGVTNATPTEYTLNGTGGSGTNIAGGNVTIAGGKGTGNALGGSLLFKTSDAGVSGSGLQSLTTKMTILAGGNVGIGSTSPGYPLDVNGRVRMTDFQLNKAPLAAGYALISDASGVGTWTDIATSGSAGPWTLSGTSLFPDSATSQVLIGSTTVADAVGNLTVKGNTVGKALAVFDYTGSGQNIIVASSAGVLKFAIDSAGAISNQSDITTAGSVYVTAGNIKIGGATPNQTLNGDDLFVSGTFETDGTARFDGTTYFGSTYNITNAGVTNLAATTVYSLNVGSTMNITNAGAVSGVTTLGMNGLLTNLQGGEAIRLSGANPTINTTSTNSLGLVANSTTLTVGGTSGWVTVPSLGVNGGTTYYFNNSGDISARYATASASLTVNGNTTLGDTNTDTLSLNAKVNTNIIPSGSVTVGDPSNYWTNGYFTNLNVGTIYATGTDLGGTTSNTFTINTDNATADTENVELIFERGTITPNASLLWNATADRFELNNGLLVNGSATASGTTYFGNASTYNITNTGIATLGSIDVNSGGITEAGAISGVTTLGMSGLLTNSQNGEAIRLSGSNPTINSTSTNSLGLIANSTTLTVGGTSGWVTVPSLGVNGGTTFYFNNSGNINANNVTTNDLTANGNTIIGNSIADTLTVTASISSSLLPSGSRNVGDVNNKWDNGYFNNIYAGTIFATATDLAGTTSNTFTINSDNATADSEAMSLIFERGTTTPNATLAWNTAQARFDMNQPLYVTGNIGSSADVSGVNVIASSSLIGPSLKSASAGNVALNIDAAGTGTITLGNTSTGSITLNRATTINGTLSMGAYGITGSSYGITSGGAYTGASIDVSGSSEANLFSINGTTVVDASRNLLNINTATISGGLQITGSDKKIFAQDQNLSLRTENTGLLTISSADTLTLVGGASGSTGATSISFDDDFLSAPVMLSETGTTAIVAGDAASIIKGINNAYAAAIGGSGGVWSRTAGLIYPTNTWESLALGGSATNSARLELVASGATAGYILWGSGSGAPDTNLYRSAANVLRTDDDLTVGGNVGIGTTVPATALNLALGNAPTLRLSYDSGAYGTSSYYGDLRHAGTAAGGLQITSQSAANDGSASITFNTKVASTETPRMRLSYAGGLSLGSTYYSTNAGANNLIVEGNIGIGSTAPTQKLDIVGNLRFSGALMPNGQAGTSTYILTSAGAGAPPTWQDPATLVAANNYWNLALGALYPRNATTDLLIGSSATSSAKFGFINVNSGTPTASISGTTGATFLTADGYLSTTARQNLTLGNSSAYNTTGNILLNPNGTGNVGIGTTAPVAVLEVVRTLSIPSSENFLTLGGRASDSSSNPRLTFTGIATTVDAARRFEIQALQPGGGTLAHLVLQPYSGNVGIGTTTPGRLLHVAQENNNIVRISNAANTNYVDLGGQSGYLNVKPSSASYGTVIRNSASDSYYANIGANNGYASLSYNNVIGTNSLNINSNGNVGVGLTTTSARLDITGSLTATRSLLLRSGDGSTVPADSHQILFGYNNSDDYLHSIRSRHNSAADLGNAIDFYVWDQGTDAVDNVPGTNLVMSLNGGNVGIGSASPGQTLDVVGNVRISGLTASLPVKTNATRDLISGAIDLATTEVTGILTMNKGGTNKNMTASAGSVAFSDADSLELTAVGTSGFLLTSAGTGTPTWTDPATLLTSNDLWSITAGAIHPKNSTVDFLLGASATASAKMSVINLNSGTPTLEIKGDFKWGGLGSNKIGTLTSNTTQTTMRAPAGVAMGIGANGGNSDIYISALNNVGIGTTTPTALLDIAGAATSSATLSFRGTTDPKINVLNGENFGIQTSVGGDAGLTERLTILNGGNVGIGSTTPSQKLDVAGSLTLGGGESILFTGTSNKIVNASGTDLGFQTSNQWNVFLTAGGNVGIGGTAANSTPTLLATSAGNVGIGTTNPNNFKLQVNGNVGAQTNNTSTLGSSSVRWANIYSVLGNYSGQITSSLATGTSPFAVSSTTVNTNLNADLLDGQHGSYYLPAGNVSGTTNYVAKFTGTNSVGNSNIFDNGTNVGIGTSAPNTTLQIMGSLAVDSGFNTGTSSLYLSHTGGSNQHKAGIFSTYTTGYGRSSSIQFALNSAMDGTIVSTADAKMTILENGNVGIGTTSPTELLQIGSAANVNATFDSSGGIFNVRYQTGNRVSLAQNAASSFGQTGAGLGGMRLMGNNGSSYGYVTAGATNEILLNPLSGNVGIGTTSPGAKLHVEAGTIRSANGTDTADLYAGSGAVGYSHLNIVGQSKAIALYANPQGGTDYTVNGLKYTRSSSGISYVGPLVFNNGSTEQLRIETSGNVGIGTTAPTSILHTVASGAKTANYIGNLLTNTSTSSTASIVKTGLQVDSTGTWDGAGAWNRGLFVNTSGGTNNVGASFQTNSGAASDSTSGSFNTYRDNATGTYTRGLSAGADIRALSASASTSELYGGAFTVGVQANTPYTGSASNLMGVTISDLSLSGTGTKTVTNSYGLKIGAFGGSGVTNSYGLYIANQTGASTLNYSLYSAGGANYFAGNMGIGTTTITYPLNVNGSISIVDGANGALRFDGANNDWQLYKAGNNLEIYDNTNAVSKLNIGTSANGAFNFYNGSGAVIFNGTGNVGIGTTSPGSQLHLRSANTGVGKLTLENTSSAVGDIEGIEFKDNGNTTGYLRVETQGGYPGKMYFGTAAGTNNPATKMTLDQNGNLGIGTTNPANFKLQVAGDVGPTTTATYDLGSSTYKWRNLYLTGGISQGGYLTPSNDNLLFNGDFESGTTDGWDYIPTVTTGGYAGNYTSQITGPVTINSQDYIPVDPTKDVLQLEGYFKKTATGSPTPGVLYFGYYAYDASKNLITTAPCGSYCYFAASGTTIPADGNWHKYSATTTGEGTSYPNFPVNTKFVRVLGLINYGASANEVTQMDHVTLKRINYGPLFVGNNFNSTNLVDQHQATKLYTTSSNHFIIEPPGSGNIGVGTTSPNTKLHLLGDLTITGGIRPATDGTTALQLQKANGTSVLDVDTTNSNVLVSGKLIANGFVIDKTNQDMLISRHTGGEVAFRSQTTNGRSQIILSPNGAPTYSRARMIFGLTDIIADPTNVENMTFAARGDTNEYWISTEAIGTGTARPIVFKRYQQGASPSTIDIMRLMTDGNVGIGTTTVPDLLTVRTTTNDVGITLAGASSGVSPTYKLADSGGTVHARIGIAGAAGNLVTNASINDLVFRNNAKNIHFTTDNGTSTSLFVGSNGRVGIGTTSPSYAFQANGPVDTNIISAQVTSSNRKIGLAVGDSRVGLHLRNDGTSHMGISSDGSDIFFGNASSSESPDNWGADLMTIKNGGNVGIGTTDPNNFKLQVSGDIGGQTNNTSVLGSSSVRFANIYSVLGNYSGQVTSSLATGTSPFAVTSTTVNTNLNADLLDGYSYNNLPYFDSSYLSGRSIADANNADNAGVTAYYAGSTNKPPGTDHSLLTLSYSADWSTQMAGDWRTNNWYVREQNSGTWGGWDLLWTSGNDGASSTLDADLLDGYNSSMVAGTSTVAVRNASGYLYANYFNTTADVTGTAASHFAIQTGSDNFIRWQTPADARTSLGLAAGGTGDIWVEKAGDTMTGSLTFSGVTNDIVTGTNEHFAIMPNGAGNVGIGTTTPSALMQILSSTEANSHLKIGPGISGVSLGGPGILIGATSGPTALAIGVNNTNYATMAWVDTTTDYFEISANNAGKALVLQSTASSNVGIGSTAPGTKLDVTGTGRFSTGIDANGTSSTITNLVLDGNTGTALNISGTSFTTDFSLQNSETIDNDTDNTIKLSFGAANGILNLTSATEAFLTSSVALNIDSATTNALNIGTGANAKTITLGNATGTTALNLNSGTGDITLTSTDIISLKPTSGVNYFNYASADNRAQFYNSGGTAYLAVGYWGSPRIESLTSSLHINYNADSHVYLFGGAASGDNRNLYVYGYDTGATAQKYGLFNVDTSGDFNIEAVSGEAIQLKTGGADVLTIASNGNVGIGSTVPTAVFQTVGSGAKTGSFTAARIDNTATTTTNAIDKFGLYINSTGTWDGSSDNSNNYGLYINVADGSPSRDWGIYTVGADKNYLSGTLEVGGFSTQYTNGLCWDGSGNSIIYDCNGTPGDYAEYYGSSDWSVSAGDIVIVDPSRSAERVIDNVGAEGSKAWVIKSSNPYQNSIVGVVSTYPNQTIGENFNPSENPQPIAISGRVPVKVSTMNGNIYPGDLITSSSIPGVGMKATGKGQIVARALDSYTNSDPNQIGTIIAQLNVSWYDGSEPDYISVEEIVNLQIAGSNEASYQVTNAVTATPINDRFAAFTRTITAIIEAGLTRTKELVVTGRAQIADLSVANLSINGQTLREYVVSIIQENQATNPVIVEVSPTPAPVATASESAWLAEVFQRESTTGEPIVEDLTVTDLLTTQDIDATSVTTESLNVNGQTQLGSLLVSQNASVAGVMTVNELDANSARIDALEAGMAQLDSVRATTAEFANATVSGTLYAQTIADLDKQIAELLNQPSMIDVITGNIPSPQDDFTSLYQVLGSISSTASQAAQLDQSVADLNLASVDIVLDANAGFIDRYFKVNGVAYIGDSLGVGNTLRVGSKLEMTDTYLSFSAGASTPDEAPVFFIQPSGKGMLALMGDLMILDEVGQVTINGNLHVAGNVSVEGSLLANVIEPLNPGESIKLSLGSAGTSLEATMAGQIASPSGQFEVLGDAGTPVATVSAQGKASFSSLSLGRDLLERPNVAGAATESSQLTQEATQTTGRAILPAGNKELIIRNPYVRRDSLIYLTPLGSTNNQVLFVKTINAPADESIAQATDERSFTVSLDNTTATDISFTWWIVN